MKGLRIEALGGLPLFAAGMDVGGEIVAALTRAGRAAANDDVVVVAQKIVSKAEGRMVGPGEFAISPRARELAAQTGREPGLVELILRESQEVLRATAAAIIVRHRSGHVLANAGIDASNVPGGNVAGGHAGTVLLWPLDADASARAIRARIFALTGARPAVIVADSMGRAWRMGTLGTAIGAAGICALDDRRGRMADLYGRTLQATVVAVADSLAAGAVLAMGEGAEGTPAALVSGAGQWVGVEDGPGAVAGLRALAEDMFR